MTRKLHIRAALAACWVPGLLMALAACGGSIPSGAASASLTPRAKAPVAATPLAGSSGASAAASAVDSSIDVYGNCTSPSLEPTEIILTCADSGWVLQAIEWTTWTATQATGVATFVYNDCNPSCAAGQLHSVPGTQVTLTDPVPDVHGQLVWSRLQQNPEPPGYDTGPDHGGPFPLPTQPI